MHGVPIGPFDSNAGSVRHERPSRNIQPARHRGHPPFRSAGLPSRYNNLSAKQIFQEIYSAIGALTAHGQDGSHTPVLKMAASTTRPQVDDPEQQDVKVSPRSKGDDLEGLNKRDALYRAPQMDMICRTKRAWISTITLESIYSQLGPRNIQLRRRRQGALLLLTVRKIGRGR